MCILLVILTYMYHEARFKESEVGLTTVRGKVKLAVHVH